MAPVMAFIAIAIVTETEGPVFFAQVRLGQHGKLFRLYKFRKFRHQPAAHGYAVTLKDDPRFTRVGRLLERSKMDELPQLWNILRGSMSFVGPRPETIEFSDCFSGRFRSVLDHRPGLFGPNQVCFRNENELYPPGQDPHQFYRSVLFPIKAMVDLEYFGRRSFLSDIGWVWRGVVVTLGVGQHAMPQRILDEFLQGQPSCLTDTLHGKRLAEGS
jgi:lipopolysaccharide/colanic/teichoic acid biosynthesis glycosyltransferase